MKRLLREPLLHFLAIGAVVFAASAAIERAGGARDEIVVTAGRVEHLGESFRRTWMRAPTPDELDGLVLDHVREEAAVREALALGLDQGDTVIRRRLRQKLEFLAGDLARDEPTDDELRAYHAAHREAFAVEARLGFRQVFLDPARRGDALARDATEIRRRLAADPSADASRLGDPILLGHAHRGITRSEVAADFGDAFAAALTTLPLGRWQGPIASDWGTHLVLVETRAEAHAPRFEDVREAVRREWETARRTADLDALYDRLLRRRTVTIERPVGRPDDGVLATAGSP